MPRRAYAASVIWLAVLAGRHGWRTAARMRVPRTTVRDWLRRFRRAGMIRVHCLADCRGVTFWPVIEWGNPVPAAA